MTNHLEALRKKNLELAEKELTIRAHYERLAEQELAATRIQRDTLAYLAWKEDGVSVRQVAIKGFGHKGTTAAYKAIENGEKYAVVENPAPADSTAPADAANAASAAETRPSASYSVINATTLRVEIGGESADFTISTRADGGTLLDATDYMSPVTAVLMSPDPTFYREAIAAVEAGRADREEQAA